MPRVDAKKFGLPAQTIVEKISADLFAIVIERKSRIIMADGKKILTKAEKIQCAQQGARVILKTTAPVCSKTACMLEEHGIEVVRIP